MVSEKLRTVFSENLDTTWLEEVSVRSEVTEQALGALPSISKPRDVSVAEYRSRDFQNHFIEENWKAVKKTNDEVDQESEKTHS